MDDFLFETKRIGFSSWKVEDFELASILWGNIEVMKLLSSNGFYTKDQIQERLDKELKNYDNFEVQYWKLYEKTTLKFMGCCGFKPTDSSGKSLEFGFQLLPEFWGFGYAREASLFCLSFALNKLDIKHIYAGHHPENIKSQKLLYQLGFIQVDTVYYEPTGLIHPYYKYNNTKELEK